MKSPIKNKIKRKYEFVEILMPTLKKISSYHSLLNFIVGDKS